MLKFISELFLVWMLAMLAFGAWIITIITSKKKTNKKDTSK